MYIFGFVVSIINMAQDNYAGRILFGSIFTKLIYDIMDEPFIKGILIMIIWGLLSIYHLDQILGIICVLILFFTFGFLFKLDDKINQVNFLIGCVIISICLNICIWRFSDKIILVFGSAVYICGSIIGSIAVLILSDLYGPEKTKNNLINAILVQILTVGYYSSMIYIGIMQSILSYVVIASVCLSLRLLDFSISIIRKNHFNTKMISFR